MDIWRHDLSKVAIGIPIQTAVKIKPNTGYFREDIKLAPSRVSLIDVNNRVQKDYESQFIFDSASSVFKIFEGTCAPFLRAVLEGVNIAIIGFGTTGSEKSYYIEGDGAEPGIINYFVKSIYESLDEKKYRLGATRNTGGNSQSFDYSVKMRYIEIVDEEIFDLLVQSNSEVTGALQIINDEWDGINISNCSWLSCPSAHHLLDMFTLARRNRTQASNEFGSLTPKATSFLTIEVLQEAVDASTSEKNIVVSRMHFIDTPGMEKLNEDPEILRIQEGNSLNRGLLAMAEMINNLISNSKDFVRYEASVITQLLKDIIGGNCLALGLFCLQNGDLKGSELVLEYMKMLQRISNFPVVNDSRQIGLLRKFRSELIYLTEQLSLYGPGSVEAYSSHISELEKQLIDNNLEKLKFIEQRSQLTERIRDLKDAYNKLVNEKVELVEKLITSEEENVEISKALIEMQIENSQLMQKREISEVDIKDKVLYAESQVLEANIEKERALKAINEQQVKDRRILEGKRELEIEFVALKTNYLSLTNELKAEKDKNENLSLEIINLVNTTKALSGDTDALAKIRGTLKSDNEKLGTENRSLKDRCTNLEKELFIAKTEIEKLKSEVVRHDLNVQMMGTDVQAKKVELEKEYLEKGHRLDNEAYKKVETAEEKAQRLARENQYAHADTVAVTRQLKIAQRKVAQLEELLSETQYKEKQVLDENRKLIGQIDELRSYYRSKLTLVMNQIGDDRLKNAREEMLQTYKAKEAELQHKLEGEINKNTQNSKIIRGLRVYSRNLKNLAEDWAPLGQPTPEILISPPPILLEEEEKTLAQRGQYYELERLKNRNSDLEREVKSLQGQLVTLTESYLKSPKDPKQQILSEIEFLKGTSRPGSSDVEILRKERNQLREENRKLHQDIREYKVRGGYNDNGLVGEVERLKKRLAETESGYNNYTANSNANNNPRGLQQKIGYLEEVLKNLEKERSELSVRATMAEEQLKSMQEHMNTTIQNYQKRLNEFKKIIQQLKGGRNMPEIDAKMNDNYRTSY
ncbi:hypothetical protein SteCoe_15755 [Stentor coeruleus]|uniref:Kinesin motor domain-containing protein n=1 Tax=Stentor coeruleus TaxID=5963 RepID=A0A1R2C2U3_9CILI|nr:hypothetical protein SteCoe_15755 [Stentor coeruleus]